MKSTFRLRPLQGAVLLALASASPFSHALRLGEPVVKSYVGQPLVAEFAIEETTPEELRRLQISLAAPTLFNNMRAVFHPSLKTSSLAILNRDSQTPKLVLRTDGPVEDSVVDIVFELTWAAGRMIQSSTVLIDPAPPGVAIDTPAFQASPVVVVEAPKPSVAPANAAGSLNATNLPPLEKTNPQTVLVKRGDTLSKIATRMGMPDVKLEQLLIALYNKNSKAIASKNMNLIREGTILALPTKQEALAVDASQAMKTVALHASNFRAYAQNLAQQSASSTSKNSGARSQTGSVTSEIIERAAPEGKDQVRIGAGEEGSTQGQASKIQLDNLQAENTSRQKELDKNLQDLAALAKLKNEQLAKMQERMNASKVKGGEKQDGLLPPPEQNTKPVPAAPVSEPVASSASSAQPAAIVKPEAIIEQDKTRAPAPAPSLSSGAAPKASSAPAAAPSSSAGGPIVETPMLPDTLRPNAGISGPNAPEADKAAEEAPKPKAPVAAAKPASKEIKPVAKAPPPAPPAPESDWTDMLPLAAGGVGIAALIGGWLYTRRKKKVESVEDIQEEEVVQETAPKVFSLDFPPSELPADAVQEEDEQQEPMGNEEQADVAMEELDQALQDNGLLLDIGANNDDAHDTEQTHDFVDVPVSPMPVVEQEQEDNPFVGQDPDAQLPESGTFEFNPDENAELEHLTRSLAQGMPSLEEPTPESDKAAYAVSLTYDPDEQLGIAKFYLGLQDFRGVWDMVTPLLEHERDDIRAQAQELLESIPEEMRDEWNSST